MAKGSLTRRGFFKAGGLAGIAAATIGVAAGCTNTPESTSADEPVLLDVADAVDVTDEFEEVDFSLKQNGAFQLPLGSVLREAEGNWIPIMSVGKKATPMVYASALSLASGNLHEVLSGPITQDANMVIFDVRCSEKVFAWVELNTVSRDWVLYARGFDDGVLLDNTSALWQADSNWDPPGIAVSDTAVIWQVRPSLSGNKTAESSFCYLWRLGAANAKAVVESPGRFAFPPSVSDGAVTLCPRVLPDSGQYYAVTSYNLSDDLSTVLDQLVFPRGVRPYRGARIGGRTVASVEANYDSGGLLGGMGTYIKMGERDFVRMVREPVAGLCGHGDKVIIKSRASYFVIDVAEKTYSFLPATDRCVDYGEYPARSGECSSFITFATVKDSGEGYPSFVSVRSFEF